jgi:hypothetical protein
MLKGVKVEQKYFRPLYTFYNFVRKGVAKINNYLV